MRLIDLARGFPRPVKAIIKFVVLPQYYFHRWKNIFLPYLGKIPGKHHIIFVAGYPKSGTTWVENFVSNFPGYSPRTLSGSHEVLREQGLPFNAFDNISKKNYSSVKTHITPDDENILVLIRNNIKKVLIMWRDPRDIIISNYYHVLKDNPWKRNDPWYADYSEMSKEDGINHSIDMVLSDYASWVSGWMNVASDVEEIDCMCLTYEDLRANPKLMFENISDFFEVKLDGNELVEIMEKSNSSRKKHFSMVTAPGLKSTKRNGIVGSGVKEMNEEQKMKIKRKVGNLLIDLGYEKDLNW